MAAVTVADTTAADITVAATMAVDISAVDITAATAGMAGMAATAGMAVAGMAAGAIGVEAYGTDTAVAAAIGTASIRGLVLRTATSALGGSVINDPLARCRGPRKRPFRYVPSEMPGLFSFRPRSARLLHPADQDGGKEKPDQCGHQIE